MQDFVRLFTELDQTTKTLKKVDALYRYFEQASDADKLWTIALLSHRRPKRTVQTNKSGRLDVLCDRAEGIF